MNGNTILRPCYNTLLVWLLKIRLDRFDATNYNYVAYFRSRAVNSESVLMLFLFAK